MEDQIGRQRSTWSMTASQTRVRKREARNRRLGRLPAKSNEVPTLRFSVLTQAGRANRIRDPDTYAERYDCSSDSDASVQTVGSLTRGHDEVWANRMEAEGLGLPYKTAFEQEIADMHDSPRSEDSLVGGHASFRSSSLRS